MLCACALCRWRAHADINSPAGLWKTIDDKTGKERSLVRITENNGVFEGKVEKIFDQQPDDDPDHLCKKVRGRAQGQADHRHDHPVGPEEGRRPVQRRRNPRSQERQDLPRQDEADRRRHASSRCAASSACRCSAARRPGCGRSEQATMTGARLKFWGWGYENRTPRRRGDRPPGGGVRDALRACPASMPRPRRGQRRSSCAGRGSRCPARSRTSAAPITTSACCTATASRSSTACASSRAISPTRPT